MRISDAIELFIKDMMGEGTEPVELCRNDLAEYFNCAPSQINYVLATRFSPDRGYLTESRRGGGGYIRILRVVESGEEQLASVIRRIGDTLSEEEAVRILAALTSREILTAEETRIMGAAVSARALAVPVTAEVKGCLRARMMRSMLLTVLSGKGK